MKFVAETLFEHKDKTGSTTEYKKKETAGSCQDTGKLKHKYLCDNQNVPQNVKNRMTDEFGKKPTPEEESRIDDTKQYYKTLPDGTKVYFVSIKPVRDISYGDFVEGGNEEAYPNFVPMGEIWIDSAFKNDKERPDQIMLHEAIEKKLMQTNPNREYYKETYKTRKSKDIKHEGAHEEANEIEKRFRDGEITLEDALNHYYSKDHNPPLKGKLS